MINSQPMRNDVFNLRTATPADVPQILGFIRDLALYECEPDAVLATEADLLRDGFEPNKRFDCIMAELVDGDVATAAGFALYFYNYSTWRGHAGIYLEDLYVSPEYRGKGVGKALLTRVAAIAVAEGCPRYEWSVLDWNTPSNRLLPATGGCDEVGVEGDAGFGGGFGCSGCAVEVDLEEAWQLVDVVRLGCGQMASANSSMLEEE